MSFECVVSHENAKDIMWALQDVPLQNSEMNEIRIEGRRHKLTLKNVAQKDSGTVSFHVGAHTSFACLTVKGKHTLEIPPSTSLSISFLFTAVSLFSLCNNFACVIK